MTQRVLAVTGALGFIGSHLVDLLLREGHLLYLLDAETYAANPSLLDSEMWRYAQHCGALKYVKADICQLTHLPDVDAVLHLAAESHVDNSIKDSTSFVRTNVLGTQRLLELVRAKRAYEMPKVLLVSTDEVYGDWFQKEKAAHEGSPLSPSSPYAASKAAADLLFQSYARTYGLQGWIVRPSNCYGARQYPEKLIPKCVRYFQLGKAMPVHATGNPQRSWLDVKDCARAILTVLEKGDPKLGIYNIAGNTRASVGEVVKKIAACFPDPAACKEEWGFERAGLDRSYWVSDEPLRALKWAPEGDLWRDLPALVEQERATFRW